MSRIGLSPRARQLIVIVLVVLATPFLSPARPARADSPRCEEVWERLVSWEEEATNGLTAIGLVSLHTLLPEVDSCTRSSDGGMGVDPESWRGLAGVYFDPGEVDRVICLMGKESGGDPGARNRSSGASGLMQVMPGWADEFGYEPVDLFDPVVNLWVASRIRDVQGWSAWSPYQRGLCR